MRLKAWVREIRPQFLVGGPAVSSLGLALAVYDGFFNLFHATLYLIGVILLTMSVSALNDYFDYKAGIDLHTKITLFSGGSGVLASKILSPRSVYQFGVTTLLLGSVVAVYFIAIYGWPFIPLVLIALISVYFYTSRFTKWRLGEFIFGLNVSLIVLGGYLSQTGFYEIEALLACISPGILASNLLLLNEFPDVDADLTGGRRNIPIMFGRETAAKFFATLLALNYFSIIAPTVLMFLPITTLLALVTMPFALKALSITLRHYDNIKKLMPALNMNALIFLLTPVLMGIGIFLASRL